MEKRSSDNSLEKDLNAARCNEARSDAYNEGYVKALTDLDGWLVHRLEQNLTVDEIRLKINSMLFEMIK